MAKLVTLYKSDGSKFEEEYLVATDWSLVKNRPQNYVPTTHPHVKADITDFAHLHDDRYYTETEINNILGNGISGNILRSGQHFMNTLSYYYNSTTTEIIIKTKIPYANDSFMPLIHLQGYAYGKASPIDLKIVFYIYNGEFENYSCISTCSWKPTIKLFSYLDGATRYVGFALCESIYYPRFNLEYIDIWGTSTRNHSAGWTTETNLTTTTMLDTTNISGYANEKTVPYKPITNDIMGNATTATKLANARTIAGVSFDGTTNIAIPFANLSSNPTTLSEYGITDAYDKNTIDSKLVLKADLVGGIIPASQLPSYVDDVLEYNNAGVFPSTGESGKIYIALDSNKTYRWTGSTYVVISETLALGETSATAYRGDKGKTNADSITNIINGTTTVGKADNSSKLGNKLASEYVLLANLQADYTTSQSLNANFATKTELENKLGKTEVAYDTVRVNNYEVKYYSQTMFANITPATGVHYIVYED